MKLLNVTEWRPDDEIQVAIDDCIAEAEKQLKEDFQGEYPPSGLGISTLRPEHLQTPEASSYNVWKITVATAYVWQDWFNITMQEDTFVVSCGLSNRTVNHGITEIGFKATGKDLCIQNIEQMYLFEEPLAWWSKPFWIKAKSLFVGRLYGEIAQVERLAMVGFAVARRAILITES